MKKVFVSITSLAVSMYLIFVITHLSDGHIFSSFDRVFLRDDFSKLSNEEILKKLDDFAKEHNTTLARKLNFVEESQEIKFVYQKFGTGDLPSALKKGNSEEIEKAKNLSNFIIVRGNLSAEKLQSFLAKLGLNMYIIKASTPLSTALMFLFSELSSSGILMLVLVYSTIILLGSLSKIREAGIKLINGERTRDIIYGENSKELKAFFLIYFFVGVITFFVMSYLSLDYSFLLRVVLLGTLIYMGFIYLAGFLTHFIVLNAVKKSSIIKLIKGKFPVRLIFAIMLTGQFLSFIIVVMNFYYTFLNAASIIEQNGASEKWTEYQDRYTLMQSHYQISGKTENERFESGNKLYNFIKEAEEKGSAILSDTKTRDFHNKKVRRLKPDEFNYRSNRIFVNYNYLKSESIEVSEAFEKKIKNLKEGEYAVILPEKYRKEEARTLKYIENDIDYIFPKKMKLKRHLEYVDRLGKVFPLNVTYNISNRFYLEPVIIVISTKSTGLNQESFRYWERTLNMHFFLKNYDDISSLIKKHGLEKKISRIINSKHDFHVQYGQRIFVLTESIATSLLGFLTAILLFVAMNKVYFEQFRRKIFIYMISGASFYENHRVYILSQILVLSFGFIVSLLIFARIIESSLVLLLTIIFLSLSLKLEAKKQSEYGVSVIKGE